MFSQPSKSFLSTEVKLENGINIWTERFGDTRNPAILLIMGAGAQCKLWPDEFCQKLAEQGYFVIRFDHRDTGKSSEIKYDQTPYVVKDLAKDAIGILNHFNIDSAHIVGFSMGGQIGQFLAAYFPQYVKSLTLMGTSTSFEEGFSVYGGSETKPNSLSAPKEPCVKWATRGVDITKQTFEEKVKDFVTNWKILSDNEEAFDSKLYREIGKDCFTRSTLDNPHVNHSMAMMKSFDEHKNAPKLINTPTIIIHGDKDPVFPMDHADSLHQAIKKSELKIVEGMGHSIMPKFYDQLISSIHAHVHACSMRLDQKGCM